MEVESDVIVPFSLLFMAYPFAPVTVEFFSIRLPAFSITLTSVVSSILIPSNV